jgi:excisionase family DNA binding protein
MKTPKPKSYLMPAEVAELLAVSVVTVRNLVEKGELKSMTTAGGHRRFHYRDVIQYAKKHNLVLNLLESSSYRIMIVDDDEEYSKMLETMLRRLPFQLEIEIATSGFRAGFKAKQNVPDLLLLDIRMSGISGIDVASTIKDDPETSGVRIIAMTGYADDESSERMKQAGAETVLQKPFTAEELVAAIGESELKSYENKASSV